MSWDSVSPFNLSVYFERLRFFILAHKILYYKEIRVYLRIPQVMNSQVIWAITSSDSLI